MSLREARALRSMGHLNGAANRAYYALYQAAIFVFDEKGLYERLVPAEKRGRDMHWPHEIVCNNAGAAGSVRGMPPRRLATQLKGLRVKSDYRPDSVEADELDALLGPLDQFLGSAGVPTA